MPFNALKFYTTTCLQLQNLFIKNSPVNFLKTDNLLKLFPA